MTKGHPKHLRWLLALIAGGVLSLFITAIRATEAQRPAPWLDDPLFKAIAARLDSVQAIDNHTHLLRKGNFNSSLLQSPGQWMWTPIYERALTEAFGVPVGPAGLAEAAKLAEAERARQIEKLGIHGYWIAHLERTRTSIVLINQEYRDGTDGDRLRWVPYADYLLYPVPADAAVAQNPNEESDIKDTQSAILPGLLREAELEAVPRDLGGYVRMVDQTLARWQKEGAAAVKFTSAYYRTLVFSDVPEQSASALYLKGFARPLSRDDYRALQDFLVRHIFLESGRLKLPVHIHTGFGMPPFVRSREADVRNLDEVLTDVRFFGTQFVLIHAGNMQIDEAGYLGLKPHVWVDVSALPFLCPVPDNAAWLRKLLIRCPDKILFGTDVSSYAWVPVGPEVMHLALCRLGREALYLALAGLVRDGLLDLDQAVKMGEMVLYRNAEKLYGFTVKTAGSVK